VHFDYAEYHKDKLQI